MSPLLWLVLAVSCVAFLALAWAALMDSGESVRDAVRRRIRE